MRSSPKKRTTARERKLEEKISELEERLASSVSKTDYETLRFNLQLEINDLQTRLSNSVPRADLDYVKSELQQVTDLDGRIVRIPTEETEELKTRISELEKLLRSAHGNDMEHNDRATSEMEFRFEELQHALSESRKETDVLKEKIRQMELPIENRANNDGPEYTDSDNADDLETDFEEQTGETRIQSQVEDE